MKRFSTDKMPQVEQFINYAKLMGLNGADIMSIGAKMKREHERKCRTDNMAIVASFECLPIGKDWPRDLDNRFKLKMASGAYNFQREGSRWRVRSLKTKIEKVHPVDPWDYKLPATEYYRKCRYAMLLDISNGKFNLNF